MNAGDGTGVLMCLDVGLEGPKQGEWRLLRRDWWRAPEQGEQARLLAAGERWVKHQLTGLCMVVADQCPGVQAEYGIAKTQVIPGLLGQRLDATTEIIAEVTEQATRERQLEPGR